MVNEQLEKMGHNIGVRLIDEFLSKTNISSCNNFKETIEIITKIAFKMFLGITPDIIYTSNDNNSFTILLTDNPFIDFVEIPPQYSNLIYCNLLIGVIKGALEMVNLNIECKFNKDILREGDNTTELYIELKGIVKNIMSDEYKET